MITEAEPSWSASPTIPNDIDLAHRLTSELSMAKVPKFAINFPPSLTILWTSRTMILSAKDEPATPNNHCDHTRSRQRGPCPIHPRGAGDLLEFKRKIESQSYDLGTHHVPFVPQWISANSSPLSSRPISTSTTATLGMPSPPTSTKNGSTPFRPARNPLAERCDTSSYQKFVSGRQYLKRWIRNCRILVRSSCNTTSSRVINDSRPP